MDALLRVVGYLVVHTRQLDMIMGDSAEVARVDEQIRTDLAEIGARAAGIPPPAGDGTSRRIKGD
jgi:pyruvate,water dikinase